MIAAPHPISSSRSCLFTAEPEVLRAAPSPAAMVMSVKRGPSGWAADAEGRAHAARPAIWRKRLRLLMHHGLGTGGRCAMLFLPEPVAALLVEFGRFALELAEGGHGLPALFGFSQFPEDGAEHVEIG